MSKEKDKKVKAAEAEAETVETVENAEATETPEVDVEKLLEFLKAAQTERDEYLLTAQRAQADLINFRRRNATVRTDALDDATRDAVAAMLPVLDNLERAIEAARKQEGESSLLTGVEMVQRQMKDALEKLGMEQVIPEAGEAFDPNLHNAVGTVPADAEHADNTICDVFQTGCRVRGKMIRYAMVRVYKD